MKLDKITIDKNGIHVRLSERKGFSEIHASHIIEYKLEYFKNYGVQLHDDQDHPAIRKHNASLHDIKCISDMDYLRICGFIANEYDGWVDIEDYLYDKENLVFHNVPQFVCEDLKRKLKAKFKVIKSVARKPRKLHMVHFGQSYIIARKIVLIQTASQPPSADRKKRGG